MWKRAGIDESDFMPASPELNRSGDAVDSRANNDCDHVPNSKMILPLRLFCAACATAAFASASGYAFSTFVCNRPRCAISKIEANVVIALLRSGLIVPFVHPESAEVKILEDQKPIRDAQWPETHRAIRHHRRFGRERVGNA